MDVRQAYFSAGLGYTVGSIIGAAKGVIHSLRRTQGRPNGMAYFLGREAQRMGHAAALGSFSASMCKIALEKSAMLGWG